MSKEIKLSEEKYHETTAAGTLVDIFTFGALGNAVDSLAGGGEKTKYTLEVNGKKETFDTKAGRDAEARKRI
jgi:hypothetical protein